MQASQKGSARTQGGFFFDQNQQDHRGNGTEQSCQIEINEAEMRAVAEGAELTVTMKKNAAPETRQCE